jgi:acetyltransferase
VNAPPDPPPDASNTGSPPGRYPSELERAWQPAGRQAVLLRALRPNDTALERRFIESLSPETLYLRAQYAAGRPTPRDLERLLDLDYQDRLAVAAITRGPDGEDRIVGVSRYARIDATRHAECAIVVADDWQGCGLGTELMRSLAQAAIARGYTCLLGTTLAENARLLAWARRFGFNVRTEPHSGGQQRVTLDLEQIATSVD